MTYVGEGNSTPSNVRQLSREHVKNDWRDEKTNGAADWSHTSCWPCHDPIFIAPSWSGAPRGFTLPPGAGPDYWRNELLHREGDVERHLVQNEHFHREDGTSQSTSPGKTAIVYAARYLSLAIVAKFNFSGNRSRTSPFSTLVSFHCLLRAAEAMHLRLCDVQIIDVSMPARDETLSCNVNIRKMAGHAA